MRVIHTFKHIEKALPIGNISVHIYFLTDYTLLFSDGFLGKIGVPYKIYQYFKILFKAPGARKKIACPVKARISVSRSASFCIALKCAQFFAFKKLVFKKMRRTRRYCRKAIAVASFKAGVNRAVVCAEHRIA